MNLRHLGAVGKGLAVARDARLISVDHDGITEDCREGASVMTDGDHRPAFVSPELREREAVRHFKGILVLGGNGGLVRRWASGRRGCRVEMGKLVDETCKRPGVVGGDARPPGGHAGEANSILYDPEQ